MQCLEWKDTALFGLVSGQHRWHIKPQGKKLLGMIGKSSTEVILDQEITGATFLALSYAPCAKAPDLVCYATLGRVRFPAQSITRPVPCLRGAKTVLPSSTLWQPFTLCADLMHAWAEASGYSV